jgi:hypothetical protein
LKHWVFDKINARTISVKNADPFTLVTLKLILEKHHRPPGGAAPLFLQTIDL